MIYVKRAAMRAMTANQAQAQVVQPQIDTNQQVQSTEIKDVTMSEANAENAQGEGKKVTTVVSPSLIPCSEQHKYTVNHPNRGSVGNCCCLGSSPWRLGSYRRSEPDSKDSISTPHPMHGNAG